MQPMMTPQSLNASFAFLFSAAFSRDSIPTNSMEKRFQLFKESRDSIQP